MNKKTNILFICKYNRYRSKIAEFYLKKYSKEKNLNIKVQSAGIIPVNRPLSKDEAGRNQYLKKRFNIKFNIKSRGINYKLLEKQDKIIIVANDVPKIIFSGRKWKNKIEIWKVPDEKAVNKVNINKSVKIIKNKVEKLTEELERK
ncbi:MAG: hypothetical protein ACOCUU_01665 [Nanoarchaeota archaeon]